MLIIFFFQIANDASELIVHALKALAGTTGDNVELNEKNCSVGIVGKNVPFKLIEGKDIQQYLAHLTPQDAQPQGGDQMEDVAPSS